MRERVADQELSAGPPDRELAEMKQRLIVDRASKVLLQVGFHRHLLARGARRSVDRGDLAANLVALICVSLSLRGWNLHIAADDDVDGAIDYLVEFVFRGLGVERVAAKQPG